MPTTRKTANTPVTATRLADLGKASQEKKKNSLPVTTIGRKNETLQKNQMVTKKVTQIQDTEIIKIEPESKVEVKTEHGPTNCGRKRKTQGDAPKDEPVKRSKVVPPDMGSPRRSSRAVVPNSRYKDMEVIDFSRKKSNTAAASEKKVSHKNTQGVGDVNIAGVNIQVEPDSVESNIVSEEIITCEETQSNDSLQMTDNILALPSNTSHTSQPATDTAPANQDSLLVIGPAPFTSNPGSAISTDSSATSNIQSISVTSLECTSGNSDEVTEALTDQESGTENIKEEDNGESVLHDIPAVVMKGKNVTPSANTIVIPSEPMENKSTELVTTQDFADNVKTERVEIKGGNSRIVILNSQSGLPKVILPNDENLTSRVIDAKKSSPVVQPECKTSLPAMVHTSFTVDKPTIALLSSSSLPSPSTTEPAALLDESSQSHNEITGKNVLATPKITVIDTGTKSGMTTDRKEIAAKLVAKAASLKKDKPHVKIVYVKMKPSEENDQNQIVDQSNAGESVLEMYTSRLKELMKEKGIKIMDSSTDQEITNTGPSKSDDKLDPSKFLVAKKTEKTVDGSPQVAIEYVLMGNTAMAVQKPFSQTNAASFNRKRSIAKKASVKVAPPPVDIHANLEAIDQKHPPLGYTVDIETASSTEQHMLKPSGILVDNSVQQPDKGTSSAVSEVVKQKPGRVIHGFVSKPEVSTGPTEIVEISQDLFAREIYGENTVLDPASGEMVSETVVDSGAQIVLEKTNELVTQPETEVSQFIVGEELSTLQTDEPQPADGMIIAGAVEKTETETKVEHNEDSAIQSTTDITAMKNIEEPVTADGNINPTFMVENMSEGDSVILQIDNGVVLAENPTFKTVTNVKINPAVSVLSTTAAEMSDTQNKVGQDKPKVPRCLQVKPVTASSSTDSFREVEIQLVSASSSGDGQRQVKIRPETVSSGSVDGQREIETQTEEEMEGGEDTAEQTQERMDKNIMFITEEEEMPRTTVVMEENGHVQEFVVVHLPDGAEIKQQDVKQNVDDPVHSEVVTMSDDGMYICMDCDHKTDKKGNWYKHRRKHLGIRPHSCPKCNYKAATSSNLKRHMQIHDDVRNYACSTCGLLFRQKIHLERHIKYKHQEKKVKCPLCDYLCSSENPDLKIHIRRRHMPQEDGSMSAFTCSECGLMTVSRKDLKQHMKFHKKGPELKLFCEFCSFVTDCESRLRRHMLIHTKEKPFQCGLCSYRASQKEHVLRHMKSQHDVEVERKPRRSLLSVANKPKQRRSLLDNSPGEFGADNKQTEVTDKLFQKSDYSSTDKIFACNHCSMKFAKLINLYKHLFAQHKQVMPETVSNFQCVVCDFRTNNKKNLLVHMRKHNTTDHSPPTHVYSCVLCRYINPRRRNLFQHMKKKHGIEIIMQEDGYNCCVSGDMIAAQHDGEPSIMALSEIVKTHPLIDDNQFQIVTEDGTTIQAEKILDNIMLVDDIGPYESTPTADQTSHVTAISSTSLYQSSIAEHEAAEAIEGLQALAEQAAGVVETQPIESDITTEIITSDIMTDGEIMTAGEATLVEHQQSVEDDGIELSTEQLSQLSAGDYVEINGEVYKVEIAQDSGPKVELALEST